MNSSQGNDPAYAFEAELAARDPTLRRERGVFLTPRPLASYLVRSVDHLLRADFGLPDGLASEGVYTVDPACGSGVFLREVLELHPEKDRCHTLLGFDVLPEACHAARGLLGSIEGVNAAEIIELDPLDASAREMARLLGLSESASAGLPDGQQPLMVLGNPPWSNFGRKNRGLWIEGPLADYKVGLVEKKHNLADDCIKFVRWGQYWIDRAGAGVLAFVVSNTFLAGLTHTAMRRSLLQSFGELYIYNLHGSHSRGEQSTQTERDENVFGVRSGVALCLLIKRPEQSGSPRVHYAELRGARQEKLRILAAGDVSHTNWKTLALQEPRLYFVPSDSAHAGEYGQFLGLDEIFGEYVSGVQTKNDRLFTDFSREVLAARMREYLKLGEVSFSETCLRPYLTAPFDLRWIYYEPRLLGRARWNVMRHMLRGNIGLVFMRQSTNPGEYDHFLAVRSLVSDRVFYSVHGAPYLAPLYLHAESSRTANLRPAAVAAISACWGLRFVSDGGGDLISTFGPDDVLHYLYAVVQGKTYREKYATELRVGFPRVPFCQVGKVTQRLCELGRALVELHTAFSEVNTANFTVAESPNPPILRLGGYSVLSRWQKQRRHRLWTEPEKERYTWLEYVAKETARLRAEVDQVENEQPRRSP